MNYITQSFTKFRNLTDQELLKLRDHLQPGESPLLEELFVRLAQKIEDARK